MERIDRGEYRLSSGRVLTANQGFIGIAPNLELVEGYDSGLSCYNWTIEERKELADYMVTLWIQFGTKDI